jgi:hypothetical protein
MPNLRYDDKPRYPMRHDEVYQALGLDPKKHLPDAGHSGGMVGNVFVWVLPKKPFAQDAARTWCACPACGKPFTAGKLAQHMKVHREEM